MATKDRTAYERIFTRYAPDASPFPVMDFARDVWRASMTLANNICVQESDRYRGDDQNIEAGVAGECAKRVRGWLDVDLKQLHGLLMASGAIPLADRHAFEVPGEELRPAAGLVRAHGSDAKRVLLHVWHDGDGSVGLPGDRATVELDLQGYDASDQREYVENLRSALKDAFGSVWDTAPKVMTDDEVHQEDAGLDVASGEGQMRRPRDFLFSMGTGDGWSCHTRDGAGIHLYPAGGGLAWNWSATKSWWNAVGTGQADKRADAIEQAAEALAKAGVDLDVLPSQHEGTRYAPQRQVARHDAVRLLGSMSAAFQQARREVSRALEEDDGARLPQVVRQHVLGTWPTQVVLAARQAFDKDASARGPAAVGSVIPVAKRVIRGYARGLSGLDDDQLPALMELGDSAEAIVAMETELRQWRAAYSLANPGMDPRAVVGDASDEEPSISITKSLIVAACDELRRYALPAGADDQVVFNLEAACGIERQRDVVRGNGAPSERKLCAVEECFTSDGYGKRRRDSWVVWDTTVNAPGHDVVDEFPGEASREAVESEVRRRGYQIDPTPSAPAKGYVLAFASGTEAEAEELVETLRRGGNDVAFVKSVASERVLREVNRQQPVIDVPQLG